MTLQTHFSAWDQILDGLPDPLLGIEPRPLWEMFDTVVRRFPDRPYLTNAQSSMTYAQAHRLVDALAMGLRQWGIRPGDRVGVCMATHPAYALAVNALWRIGATGVGMNPVYGEPMLTQIVADSGARLILTTDTPSTLDKIQGVAQRNGAGLVIFRHDTGDLARALAEASSAVGASATGAGAAAAGAPDTAGVTGATDIAGVAVPAGAGAGAGGAVAAASATVSGNAVDALTLLRTSERAAPVAIDVQRGVAMIQYTGGTTGDPKGVMLTHANLCASCVQQCSKLRLMRPGAEVTYVSSPFSHIGSLLAALIYTTAIAGELVMADRFKAAEGLATIAQHRVTFISGSPTLMIALMRDAAAATTDWTSLKYVLSAAAPTPPEVKKAFEALTGADVRICYGSTETGPGIAMQGGEDYSTAVASTGTPFPLTDVSIRDPDEPEAPLPPGTIGEICVAGPQVMLGYWGKPEITAATFIGKHVKTGDLGYLDADGRLYLVDRLKDVINVSGYKVYPALIEAAVHEHPAISEALVAGLLDPYRGETVMLCAVLKPGCNVTLPELQTFLAEKLSPMEMPKQFEIRTELPKTAAGKLSRVELRRQFGKPT